MNDEDDDVLSATLPVGKHGNCEEGELIVIKVFYIS